MSNLTWTLWFAVHHGLLREQAADADFDYDAEAADKFAQAVRDLDDPGFGRLDRRRPRVARPDHPRPPPGRRSP